MCVRGYLHVQLKHACDCPKLPKTARAVLDSLEQFRAIARYSHATGMRVLGTGLRGCLNVKHGCLFYM